LAEAKPPHASGPPTRLVSVPRPGKVVDSEAARPAKLIRCAGAQKLLPLLNRFPLIHPFTTFVFDPQSLPSLTPEASE
jgi:hypothetical protein